MSKFFTRLQGALLERRIIRAIVWFVTLGVLLYLTAVSLLLLSGRKLGVAQGPTRTQ